MPWGLQTHIYAPAGVDLRNKWQICGNEPGEAPETRELGIDAPSEGLYLREDIQITCNMTMVSFVKKETKAASKVLVERLIKKAELLDSGALNALFENGKLKTINPADRSQRPQTADGSKSPLLSPRLTHKPPPSPKAQKYPPQPQPQNIIMELPGDFYHPQPQGQPSPNPQANRFSTQSDATGVSPNPSEGRWSHLSSDYQPSSVGSRPSSYTSDGFRSPGVEQKSFATELPTMEETREEYEDSRRRHESGTDQKYRYNPQDFAQMSPQPPQYSSQSPYQQYTAYRR